MNSLLRLKNGALTYRMIISEREVSKKKIKSIALTKSTLIDIEGTLRVATFSILSQTMAVGYKAQEPFFFNLLLNLHLFCLLITRNLGQG
jgi:hypothetical protein